MTSIYAVIATIICALLASIAQILYKTGSKNLKFDFSIIKNYHIIGGLMLYGFSAVLFIAALRHGSLSTLYPIMATSYIWVSLLAYKFLGERMNIYKWIGMTFIFLGVFLINLSA